MSKPISFTPGILSFYIIAICIFVFIFVLLYSFYLNNKLKFYSKLHYRWTTITLISIVGVFFTIMAIYLTVITSHDEDNFFINNSYVTPCSWVLVFLTYLYLSLLFLIKYYVNRAKHDLVKFRDEDFNGLLKQMQQIKFDEAKFFQKHLRYTSHIQQRYEMIMFTIQKNQNIVYDQLLADIVVFNEIFTIKWNKRYNLFQMKKFYELCIALQQKLNNTSRQ